MTKKPQLPKWHSTPEQDAEDIARLEAGMEAGDPKAYTEILMRGMLGGPIPPSPYVSTTSALTEQQEPDPSSGAPVQ